MSQIKKFTVFDAFILVLKTVGFSLFTMIIVFLLTQYNITFFLPQGNHTFVKTLVTSVDYSSIIIFLLTYGILSVSLEEYLFRVIPFNIWKSKLKKYNYWTIGFITAILFSLVHSIGSSEFIIGFPQLALGIYLWDLIRKEKGYIQCIIAHFTFNATLLFVTTALIDTTF